MFTNAAVAPRGQVTARNDPGEVPDHSVGPRHDPRALSGPVISFEPPTRRWLSEAIYVYEGRGGAQRPGDGQKRSGEVPDHPLRPRPDPRAISGPVISFEAPTRRWLSEAINGLLGHEALGDKGSIGKVWGKSTDHPEWPRPDPLGLCGRVISFEAPTLRWLPEAINGLLDQEALGDKGDYREGSGEVPGPP